MEHITETELKSFHYAFQLSKTTIFNVSYYRPGNNRNKHFTTSADHFNLPKSDYDRCGQGQNDLLIGFPIAMAFYKKFDPLHLKDLTDEQYTEISEGIAKLKTAYNYLHNEGNNDFSFSDSRTLSMQKLK